MFEDEQPTQPRGIAGPIGSSPEELTGLTDAAKYRAYVVALKGGVVVTRKGTTVFTIEGTLSRERLTDLTKVLLPHL